MQTVGGRYVLDGRLGEGGMGEVYRARHAQLGKSFALKIISPAFAADTVARARFNREAQLASEITHPNIVSVVDYGEDPTFGAYMVMELVDGEPLLFADSSGPPSVRRALDILAQVADALDHIHKRGIIHGDVKADNIMLVAEPGSTGTRRRRMVRLLDFGLARRHGTEEEGISGSPHYLAPERCAGGPANEATDVYALGVLGYLLFTRTVPFDGNIVQILTAHIQDVPDRLSARRGDPLDDSIEKLIERGMAKDPKARHPSAAAFRYELNTVMDMLDMGRRRPKASATPKPENRREAGFTMLFDQSSLAQALVSVDGTIRSANRAFAKLVEHASSELDGLALTETALVKSVPNLMRAIRMAHVDGKSIERRVEVSEALELTLWITPTPIAYADDQLHLVIRVSEIDRNPPVNVDR